MRYLPLTPEDRSEMLARIGVPHIDALFADIPASKRLKSLPDLPLTKSEIEVERTLGRMQQKQCAEPHGHQEEKAATDRTYH